MLETRKLCRENGVEYYFVPGRQEEGGAPLTLCLMSGRAEALLALEVLDNGNMSLQEQDEWLMDRFNEKLESLNNR